MVDTPKVEAPKKTVRTVPAIRYKGPGEKIGLAVPVPTEQGYTTVEMIFTSEPVPITAANKRNVDAALAAEKRSGTNRLQVVEVPDNNIETEVKSDGAEV